MSTRCRGCLQCLSAKKCKRLPPQTVCHQFWGASSARQKRGYTPRARVLYARMTARCLHHLHHFYKIRRSPSKIWRPLFFTRGRVFFTGGRDFFTGGHHAKHMCHHNDVVQVVQAPNTHTREISRAREALGIAHSPLRHVQQIKKVKAAHLTPSTNCKLLTFHYFCIKKHKQPLFEK
jgi:hypothetical protein